MPRQWRKVGTKDNRADISRGLKGFEIISNRWKRGPEFLWQDESAWPTNPAVTEIAREDEGVKNQVKCCISSVQHGPIYRELLLLASSEKSVAWLFHSKIWLRENTRSKERPPSVISDPLDALELQAAETAIIKSVQRQYFKGELGVLKARKPIVKKSPMYILEPFLDEEGLLRVGGCPKNAPLPEKAQHPILLPKNHHVSRLVARQAHEFQSGHSGKEYGLSLIRLTRPMTKLCLLESTGGEMSTCVRYVKHDTGLVLSRNTN